jgi:hypothetical protein
MKCATVISNLLVSEWSEDDHTTDRNMYPHIYIIQYNIKQNYVEGEL